jgi:3',5'-cyclic-AMP phosphodiesterase
MPGAGTMIIAQISDSHIALDAPDALRRISDLGLTVADINTLDPLPDAIVHTGDITHNGREHEYAQTAAILANARVPVYVLAGNKDNRANLRAAFSRFGYMQPGFDFVQYAIDRYPVRLIALDTLSEGNKGEFCGERLRHLTDLVKAETTKPIAVFTHHPPFLVTEGPEPFHFESQHSVSMLSSALRRSGRVVAIFSGHVHRAAWGAVADIPAMVMPATATTLRHGHYPAHRKSQPVYHVHRFDPIRGFSTETRIAARLPL